MSRPRASLINALKSNVPRSSKLLLAISGGRDSVAMLHAITSLRKLYKLHLEIAHVDHALRPASKKDAEFVGRLAEQSGCEFHLMRCGKKPAGANIEAWARLQRYEFFEKIRVARKLEFTVTAHTANDVAETLLMRLVSNKDLRTIDPLDFNRALIRPILAVTRSEIDRYVSKHSLHFREDETNRDTRFLRNRVRRKLLPLLAKEFDERIAETLSERAAVIDEDIRGLYDVGRPHAKALAAMEWGSRNWFLQLRNALLSLPKAAAWRLMQDVMLPKLGFRLGRDKCCEIVAMVEGRTSGVELPGGAALKRKGGGILFS
ncbi:MAG: tRNA lysidine(34) synthetase TilS [Deltaproteobacteria bacterium]|nr:tRNA lysidine(34) synthetase TilS [Deltaproteobacteria bacterium]